MGAGKAGWGDREWIPACRPHHQALDAGEPWVKAAVAATAPRYFERLK